MQLIMLAPAFGYLVEVAAYERSEARTLSVVDKPDERSVGQFEDEIIGAIGSNKRARLGPMRKF